MNKLISVLIIIIAVAIFQYIRHSDPYINYEESFNVVAAGVLRTPD